MVGFSLQTGKIMNRSEAKQKRLEYVLELLSKEPMTPKEMAIELQVTDCTGWEYMGILKRKKLVYIHEYVWTPGGPVARYMTGNKEDVEKPKADKNLSRAALRKLRKANYFDKNNPRCDIAAQWMRNPV